MRDEIDGGRRIVAGVDGSSESVRALTWAFEQAELTGATVEAVQALDMTTSFGMTMTVSRTDTLQANAERALSEAVARAADGRPRVPVEQVIRHGHPAEILVELSDGADLLVVGNRGLGGFAGSLLGSVSRHCTSHDE